VKQWLDHCPWLLLQYRRHSHIRVHKSCSTMSTLSAHRMFCSRSELHFTGIESSLLGRYRLGTNDNLREEERDCMPTGPEVQLSARAMTVLLNYSAVTASLNREYLLPKAQPSSPRVVLCTGTDIVSHMPLFCSHGDSFYMNPLLIRRHSENFVTSA
jgi:hypothetical protein